MQDFQKIRVWQRARALSLRIHELASRLPLFRHGTLKLQLTRAADAIGATIAEGSGAASQREFARFLDMSIKSTSETQHHLITAGDRRLIPVPLHTELVDETCQIRRMVFTLRKKVLGSPD
jgi:four helix bundle protein